jgi:tetratricopeptide (TPR) repeat protein
MVVAKKKSDSTSEVPFKGSDDTQIDLGDDLLESTAISTGIIEPSESSVLLDSSPDAIEDQLHSAQILVAEGFLEEAKKVLHRVLIAAPKSARAREQLNEIHEIELKHIFSEERSKRRPFLQTSTLSREEEIENSDPEAVLHKLDQDLGLGIFPQDGEKIVFSLFEEFSNAGPKDRIDVGVAFLEMGLSNLALQQFQAASKDYAQKYGLNHPDALSATSLMAYALILSGRPLEATFEMQSVLQDSEITPQDKLEFIYLMGRAHESMNKPEVALQWYQQAREINAHYRDIEDRLKRLAK